MEEQIKNLINLSKQYVEYAKSQNQTEPLVEYGDCRVYLAESNTVSAVEFDREKVEVELYTDKISLPLNATTEYLQAIYEDAKNYLEKLKS